MHVYIIVFNIVYFVYRLLVLGSGVVYAVLYVLCLKSRNKEVMRRRQWWTWNIILLLLVSAFLITVALLPKESDRSLLGYLLVAVVLFCLVETAQPIFDYGLMQFFLRLPMQVAIARYKWHFTVGYVLAGLLLVLGTVCQVYAVHRVNERYDLTTGELQTTNTVEPEPEPITNIAEEQV